MKSFRKYLVLSLSVFVLFSCSAPGHSPKEKRKSVDSMSNDVLKQLYKLKPYLKSQIKEAAGYAVFSSANVNVIVLSASGGYGKVVDNKTHQSTYMKMAAAGIGVGAGVKNFKAVFIFHHQNTLNRFVNEGWEFGAQADAAAKAGEKGDSIQGEMVINDISIYQLTESGLALQATVQGTRYWKDDALN